MSRSRISRWAVVAALAACSMGSGHRLPSSPPPVEKVPEGGFELHMVDQLQELADYVTRRTVRVEVLRLPPPPHDQRNPLMEDGAGAIVARGRLLTTARYLKGAESVRLVRRDGSFAPAEVLRLDTQAGFALLAFDPDDLPRTGVVEGLAPIPEDGEQSEAFEVVVPRHLVGESVSVRVAAMLRDSGDTFLSGLAANGLPVFDKRGRLVALAERPTPDRTRSVVLETGAASEWLGE